jgi:U3 small nucleolar RNA-associated protein 21
LIHFIVDTRERQWDNILTCHSQLNFARTWSYQNKTIGKHELALLDNGTVKAVSVSACGNYGMIGSSLGQIEVYNMQSGLHRKTMKGHTKSITGLCTDAVSKTLISTSLDGTVRFWDMSSGNLMETISIPAPVSQMIMHTESNLIALITDDLCIRVIDVEGKRVVREFSGHSGRLTDIAFSPDGRWIISSSLDSTIRTWDLPTGYCVGCMKSDSIPTSLSFSPTSEFIATTHVDHVGILLWVNRSLYEAVPLRKISEEEAMTIDIDAEMGVEKKQEESEVETMEIMDEEALNSQLITLSQLPKSKWQNLLHLEQIKKRNKPKEAPKAPEKAPFFLPTVQGAIPKFDTIHTDSDMVESHALQLKSMDFSSEFCHLLKEGHGNYECKSINSHWYSFSMVISCQNIVPFSH